MEEALGGGRSPSAPLKVWKTLWLSGDWASLLTVLGGGDSHLLKQLPDYMGGSL